MTRSADYLAHVAALRQLAGREQPVHHRIASCIDGTERLAASTRAWRAFAPRRAALDDAIAQADGIARALRELRTALHQGGTPDA